MENNEFEEIQKDELNRHSIFIFVVWILLLLHLLMK